MHKTEGSYSFVEEIVTKEDEKTFASTSVSKQMGTAAMKISESSEEMNEIKVLEAGESAGADKYKEEEDY